MCLLRPKWLLWNNYGLRRELSRTVVREVQTGITLVVGWLPRVNYETLMALLKPVEELGLPILFTVSDKQGSIRKSLETMCPDMPHQWCPSHYLNGFLFGINATRVKEEIRGRLIRYQEECYRILTDAFLQPVAADDNWMTTSPETRAALMQIRENARAVMHMAEEQLRLTERLDRAAVVVGQHGRRIIALERQLSPRNAITNEQATDIAEKVKAVAMELTEQDSSKNHFQAIFAELHRRFRVSSYKNIRQGQYQAVLDFLDEWEGRK